jgi:hypothetical protein
MKEFTVSMAFVDFIPVIFFTVAAIMLQRDLYGKMSKGAFALFAAGTIDIIFAGALKAGYKLLYAAGICDFTSLNSMFFPTQSIGFLLAGIGVVAMLVHRQGRSAALAAPPVFSGTFVFVGIMIVGLAMMDVGLCVITAKMKKTWVVVLFVVSFVCSLGMGYLSSRSFAEASMNWIAEGVNIAGQGTLLLGVVLLHKSGLGSIELTK